MNPILLQTIFYGVVMIITFMMVSLIQKGFFWKYLRARLSFGKLILVKNRSITRDFFSVGRIEEGFLLHKPHGDTEIIPVSSDKNKNPFYRALAVWWCDVDDEKNAFCTVDYSAVEGYDAEKFQSLYERALYKPQIATKKEKILIVLVIVAIGIALAAAYFGYINNDVLLGLQKQLSTIKTAMSSLQGASPPAATI